MTKNYLKFKRRIRVVSTLVMCVWLVFIYKLFTIQIIDRVDSPQGMKVEMIKGKRGNIFDAKGSNITQNLTFYNIGVHPKKIANKEIFLRDLSNCTGTDLGIYNSKFNIAKSYVQLEKKTIRNCEELKSSYGGAIVINQDYKRYYPEENLFGQIVGFTNVDDIGIVGLESQYNKYLEPKTGSRVFKRNGFGKRIADPTLAYEAPKDGSDIFLTLNKEYQAILREELIDQVEKTEASSAMGIILNPQTGEIVSMVSVPDFNPNNPEDFEVEYQKNRLLLDTIEPGSTFKVVTIAAALKSDINPMKEYNVEGPYNFHNIKMIEDSEPHSVLTVKEILAYSSNIGTIKIAESLGKDKIYNQAKEFGFGSKTGLNPSSEENGIVYETKKWSKSSMHSFPLGYELTATPIQIAMAYAAIANGGFLLKPYMVDQVRKSDNTILKNEKRFRKRILSQSDAEILKDMLAYTVENGSGKKAKLAGWDVSGKTGTSKKIINGQYSESEFISSFVGFFPKENPQLLALIIIDGASASSNYHWGSMSAAPVFQSVMTRIINIDSYITNKKTNKKLKPKNSDPILIQKNIKKSQNIEMVDMPNVIGKNVNSAFMTLAKKGLNPKIVSGMGVIISQSIDAGQKIEKGTRIELKAEIK
ncbi:transpeptidase family protein [Candidatus Marinimicrobia bacterium]|nr:transpeptidase family protein [Candidatus Neomarinimicrobiota bacterium]